MLTSMVRLQSITYINVTVVVVQVLSKSFHAAFYCQVEVKRFPHLRGKPSAVTQVQTPFCRLEDSMSNDLLKALQCFHARLCRPACRTTVQAALF